MTHKVSEMSSVNDPAVTEHGTKLERYSKDNVDLALRLLILNGNDRTKTVEQLAEQSIVVTKDALKYWRDSAFLTRYHNLRAEMSTEVGEKVAGRAMERAMQADAAAEEFIELAREKKDEIPAKDLAPSARAMAQVLKENVEKAQLLRDRPTSITETRSVAEMVAQLAKLGIQVTVNGNDVIDGTAEEA